jgi:HSP20 family protein
MTNLQRRESRTEPVSTLGRVDRLFDEWMRGLAMRRPFPGWDVPGEEIIRVDEYRENGTQVIRAEIPGIDPEKDVELTVSDGMLRIAAQRRVEEKIEDKGYTRHELRKGSMTRTLPLPDAAAASDITATYNDGILEIRVPIPEVPAGEPTRIAVSRG